MIEPTAQVYRCYDGADRLLYVGVSMGPESRLKQHARTSRWFGDVARVTVSERMTRREALDAEYEALCTEQPIHNRQPRPRVVLPPIEAVPGCDCAEPDLDAIGMCLTCKRKPRDLLRRPA